jgi:hypothetical protein
MAKNASKTIKIVDKNEELHTTLSEFKTEEEVQKGIQDLYSKATKKINAIKDKSHEHSLKHQVGGIYYFVSETKNIDNLSLEHLKAFYSQAYLSYNVLENYINQFKIK